MAHLYASFNDAALAEKAAGALLDYGVRKEDISIVANDAYGRSRTTHRGGTAIDVGRGAASDGTRSAMGMDEGPALSSDSYNTAVPYGSTVEAGAADQDNGAADMIRDYEAAAKDGISTTTPEDAGQGAVRGTEIGLGVGILAGIAALLVPGVGLVIGGGALAAAIGGAALTAGAGAIAGGVTGYLKEQGVPGEAAHHYQSAVENGGAILNISLPSGNVDQATAEQVLGKYSAANVHSY